MAEEGESERLSKKASSVTVMMMPMNRSRLSAGSMLTTPGGHVKHANTVWGFPNLPPVIIPGSGAPDFQDRYPDHHSDCVSYPKGVET